MRHLLFAIAMLVSGELAAATISWSPAPPSLVAGNTSYSFGVSYTTSAGSTSALVRYYRNGSYVTQTGTGGLPSVLTVTDSRSDSGAAGQTVSYLYEGYSNDSSTSNVRLTNSTSGSVVIGYTVNTVASPAGTGSVSGAGLYAANASATFAASPAAGYLFTGWSGGASGSANPINVTITSNATVTGNFAVGCTLSTGVSPAGGGTVTVGGTFASGTVVPLTATAASGYRFSGWSGDLSGTSASQNLTVNGNKSVMANFTRVYTVSVSASPAGAGTVSGAGLYDSGASASLGASANTGYAFSSWSGALSGSSNPQSLTVNSDKSVTAVFVPVYNVSTSVSPAGAGSVSGGGSYAYGASASLGASANTGYAFSSWSGALSGSSNPQSLTVNGNTSVTANFTAQTTTYTLSASVSPTGAGTVSGTGSFTPGATAHPLAEAGRGYAFSGWTGDASGPANPASVTMNGNKTVTASFSPLPSYTVAATVSPAGSGSVSGAKSYFAGETAIVAAVPSAGFVFVGWSDGLSGTTNPQSFAVNANKNITAMFERAFTVTATATPSAGGVVHGGGIYRRGSVIDLSAVPNTGYVFSGWSGALAGSTTPQSLTVDADKTVTATFAPALTVSVSASPSYAGTVRGAGTFAVGTPITLEAVANQGFSFLYWEGDASGTTNPLPMVVDRAKTVRAVFNSPVGLFWTPPPPSLIAPGQPYSLGIVGTSNPAATYIELKILRNGALMQSGGNGQAPGGPSLSAILPTSENNVSAAQRIDYIAQSRDNAPDGGAPHETTRTISASTVIDTPPAIVWKAGVPETARVTQPFVIQAEGTDADGNLAKIEVWHEREGGQKVTNSSGSPVGALDSPASPPFKVTMATGPVTVYAHAIDQLGLSSPTITHTVTITNETPTVEWEARPPLSAVAGTTFPVRARAHDADGNLLWVQVYAADEYANAQKTNAEGDGDDYERTTPAGFTYTLDASKSPVRFYATAFDSLGLTYEIFQDVTVIAPCVIGTAVDPAWSGSVSVSPSETVSPGTGVTLNATANVGYRFVRWTEHNPSTNTEDPLSGGSSTTFTAVRSTTITAHFELSGSDPGTPVPPSITWRQTPPLQQGSTSTAEVVVRQPFTIEVAAHDDNGNLRELKIARNGSTVAVAQSRNSDGTDNPSGTSDLTVSDTFTPAYSGSITYTATATDTTSNSPSKSFNVVVLENVAPVITWAADMPSTAGRLQRFNVQATARDADARKVVKIEIRRGNDVIVAAAPAEAIETLTTAQFWDSVSAIGPVTYEATAWDAANASTTIQKTVNIVATTASYDNPSGPPNNLPSAPAVGSLVGTLSGDLSVDTHGNANYSLPLGLPVGRAGVEPKLSLNYSSASGNGLLGLGFTLSTGYPRSIVRGRTIRARDGATRAVRFTADDALYLDGQRLLSVGGGSYRTEVDSFATFTTTSDANGIRSFTMTDRTGTKFYFGDYGAGTADGFQPGILTDGTPDSMAYTWALKRVEDTIGNSVDLFYDNLVGEYVLSRIEYTKGAGRDAMCRVNFSYAADRFDHSIAYVAGRKFPHQQRLETIVASIAEGASWAERAKYSLTYQYADHLPGESLQGSWRLQLHKLTGAMWDGSGLNALRPTIFHWAHSSVAPAIAANGPFSTNTRTSTDEGYRYAGFGDFNGDGREEWISVTTGNIAVSAVGGNQLAGGSWWSGTMPGVFATAQIGGSGSNCGIILVDLNGDGRKDLLLVKNDITNTTTVNTPDNQPGPVSALAFLSRVSEGREEFVPTNVLTLSAVQNGGGGPRLFDRSDPYDGNDLTYFRGTVQGALLARFAPGDFYGDGREEVAVSGYDGFRYFLKLDATGALMLTAPVNPGAPDSGAKPAVETLKLGWVRSSADPFEVVRRVDWPIDFSLMPLDLNGDGVTDFVWQNKISLIDFTAPAHPHSATKEWRCALGDGASGELPSTGVATGLPTGISGDIPTERLNATDTVSHYTQMALPADFNGDGISDILVWSEVGWNLLISKGNGETTTVPALPATFTSGGETLYTASRFMAKSDWDASFQSGLGGTNPTVNGQTLARIQADSSANTMVLDVNLDGLPDLVWLVEYKRAYSDPTDKRDTDASAANRGWWVAYNIGGRFAAPRKLTSGFWTDPLVTSAHGAVANISGILAVSVTSSDLNGDGIADWVISRSNQHDMSPVAIAYGTGGFGDVIDRVTNGLEQSVDVGYRAAKDEAIYTPGAPVTYPIREIRGSNPVVSDVWRDSGTNSPGDRAHFSYQYSGNRMDLSGRGALGFHSFVVLDQQTSVFRYQFLTQSFPMTGLIAREETYRYLGPNSFDIISSHDNTVVFDKVASSSGITLWPFIAKAVERRWESGAGHVAPDEGGLSSNPQGLFRSALPTGAHVVVTVTSQYDDQDAPQLTLPAGIAHRPSDTVTAQDGGRSNVVVGVADQPGFDAMLGAFTAGAGFGKITYGNLVRLTTTYDPAGSAGEEVRNHYLAPVDGITGLVDYVETYAWSPGHGSAAEPEQAPKKTYTYWHATGDTAHATALVHTEHVDASRATNAERAADLTTTTTYERDQGRVISTSVDGAHLLSLDETGSAITTFQASSFDERTDQPTVQFDAYGHPTTSAYHPVFGKPISVTGPNGDTVSTRFDGLGRVVQITDELKNLVTNIAYEWDDSVQVTAPAGIGGLSLRSSHRMTVTATVKPATTTYYDRLGRVIRTARQNFGGTTLVDTIYNAKGQIVAVSNPYPDSAAADNIPWTRTTYDEFGRVKTAIAPNGTATSTDYRGRAVGVTVDAPQLTGAASSIDPAPETNWTLVDAKGRTVKVWNANHNPGSIDRITGGSNTPSIAFDLDGFGRMRETILRDQSQHILATYDALGRQASLNDPDKGPCTYKNSALGFPLEQVDARLTVTRTSYDALGQPIARVTSEAAPSNAIERTNWYYYDDSAANPPHRVPLGTAAGDRRQLKGWVGALAREETTTSGAPGYAATAARAFSSTVHSYDEKGRPAVDVSTVDEKWFYTYTDYDAYSRVRSVRHYWRPARGEAPAQMPYVWQDFGYNYEYDSRSYVTAVKDSLDRTWWKVKAGEGYDYLDRPVVVQKGNGCWTRRTYQPTDETLLGITTGSADGDGTVQDLAFQYDGLGNLRFRSGRGGSEAFGYDIVNRLTSRKLGGGAETSIATYDDNGNIAAKVDVAGGASGAYAYSAVHPHAVTAAFGYQMTYDANGNLQTRTNTAVGESWTIAYAGFDKPRWMARTTGSATPVTVGSEFLYNANRSRTVQLEFTGLGSSGEPSQYVRKRVYGLGPILEANYEAETPGAAPEWVLKKVRIYVPAPDGIVGAREFEPDSLGRGTETSLVYHYDHLGSIEAVTLYGASSSLADDRTGKPGQFSEDAWGQRRNPNTWTGKPTTTDDGGADSLTPRGFTGHEMLDDLGLVHMNGRIYDPLLGRFLSADVLVQNAGDLQAYNRYSYVLNNPLRFTDPSGFEAKTADEEQKERQEQERAAWRKLGERGIIGFVVKDGRLVGVIMTKAAANAAAQAAENAQPSATPAKARTDRASAGSGNPDQGRITSESSKSPSTQTSDAQSGTRSDSADAPNSTGLRALDAGGAGSTNQQGVNPAILAAHQSARERLAGIEDTQGVEWSVLIRRVLVDGKTTYSLSDPIRGITGSVGPEAMRQFRSDASVVGLSHLHDKLAPQLSAYDFIAAIYYGKDVSSVYGKTGELYVFPSGADRAARESYSMEWNRALEADPRMWKNTIETRFDNRPTSGTNIFFGPGTLTDF